MARKKSRQLRKWEAEQLEHWIADLRAGDIHVASQILQAMDDLRVTEWKGVTVDEVLKLRKNLDRTIRLRRLQLDSTFYPGRVPPEPRPPRVLPDVKLRFIMSSHDGRKTLVCEFDMWTSQRGTPPTTNRVVVEYGEPYLVYVSSHNHTERTYRYTCSYCHMDRCFYRKWDRYDDTFMRAFNMAGPNGVWLLMENLWFPIFTPLQVHRRRAA